MFLLSCQIYAQSDQSIKLPTITTTDGETYSDVTVTRINGTEVRFMHSNGVKSIPLSSIQRDAITSVLFEKVGEQAKLTQLEKEKQYQEQLAKEQRAQAEQAAEMEKARALLAENKPLELDLWRKILSGKKTTEVKELIGPPLTVKEVMININPFNRMGDYRKVWIYHAKVLDSDSGTTKSMHVFFESSVGNVVDVRYGE